MIAVIAATNITSMGPLFIRGLKKITPTDRAIVEMTNMSIALPLAVPIRSVATTTAE